MLGLANEVLARGKLFRFRALGWSMTPFIRDGDVITIAPLRHLYPGIGSIVAFAHPVSGNMVVHRVIEMKGNSPVIKGDNGENCFDGVIPFENILGFVTDIERNSRRIWLGLGPERFLIAWLSRFKLLTPLRTTLASLRGRGAKRQVL